MNPIPHIPLTPDQHVERLLKTVSQVFDHLDELGAAGALAIEHRETGRRLLMDRIEDLRRDIPPARLDDLIHMVDRLSAVQAMHQVIIAGADQGVHPAYISRALSEAAVCLSRLQIDGDRALRGLPPIDRDDPCDDYGVDEEDEEIHLDEDMM